MQIIKEKRKEMKATRLLRMLPIKTKYAEFSAKNRGSIDVMASRLKGDEGMEFEVRAYGKVIKVYKLSGPVSVDGKKIPETLK